MDNFKKEHPGELWQLVVNARGSRCVDDVLASTGNMSMEERLLKCHFLEVASKAGT